MTPFRQTPEGFLVTTNGVKLVSAGLALLVTLCVGALGAARFAIHTADAVTRTEFISHVTRDSLIHIDQFKHTAFTDSIITENGKKLQATICFVYHNPKPFCDDQPRKAP